MHYARCLPCTPPACIISTACPALTARLRMQLFRGGIRYLSGGAASGFHHHEDAPHKATLAQIKVNSVSGFSKASAGIPTHRLAFS